MTQSSPLKYIKSFVLLLLHPIVGFFVATVCLVWLAPNYFGVQQIFERTPFFFQVFMLSVLIPAFALGMLKQMNLIEGENEMRKDRVVPYIVMSTFYLWYYLNIKDQMDIFVQFKQLVLGMNIVIFVCLFSSVFEKINFYAAFYVWLLLSVGRILIYIKVNYLFDNHAYGIDSSVIFPIFASLCALSYAAFLLTSEKYSVKELALSAVLGILSFIVTLI